jgi:hypothetical protein
MGGSSPEKSENTKLPVVTAVRFSKALPKKIRSCTRFAEIVIDKMTTQDDTVHSAQCFERFEEIMQSDQRGDNS